jgi:hypothetical protein
MPSGGCLHAMPGKRASGSEPSDLRDMFKGLVHPPSEPWPPDPSVPHPLPSLQG